MQTNSESEAVRSSLIAMHLTDTARGPVDRALTATSHTYEGGSQPWAPRAQQDQRRKHSATTPPFQGHRQQTGPK